MAGTWKQLAYKADTVAKAGDTMSGNLRIDANLGVGMDPTAKIHVLFTDSTISVANSIFLQGINHGGILSGVLNSTPLANASFSGFNLGNDTGGGTSYGFRIGSNFTYDGTNWISRNSAIYPVGIYSTSGALRFVTNSLVTVNNSYTPSERMVILNGGNVGINKTSPTATLDIVSLSSTTIGQMTKISGQIPTLDTDIVANGGFASDLTSWTSGGNWAWEAGTDGQARHTAGSTATLSQTVTIVGSSTYILSLTITGRTAGSVEIDINGVKFVNSGASTTFSASSNKPLAPGLSSGSYTLSITPSSDFDGAISLISVSKVLTAANSSAMFLDDTDNEVISFKGSYAKTSNYVGSGAGRYSYGSGNTAFGYRALYSATYCDSSTAIGRYALYTNGAGASNTGVGDSALRYNTTGSLNTAVGTSALQANTTGQYNVGIGASAFIANTTGYGNVGIGYNVAAAHTTGTYNVVIGYSTAASMTGSSNIAIGYYAMRYSSTGQYNIVLGYEAMRGSSAYTATNHNIVMGFRAGYQIAGSCDYNILLGYSAGYSLTSSKDNNIFLGLNAGYSNTGSGSIMIGANAGYNETASDMLYIANTNTNTPIIKGKMAGTGAGLFFYSQATDGVPLSVIGIASQASNLVELRDSANTLLSAFDKSGYLGIGASPSYGTVDVRATKMDGAYRVGYHVQYSDSTATTNSEDVYLIRVVSEKTGVINSARYRYVKGVLIDIKDSGDFASSNGYKSPTGISVSVQDTASSYSYAGYSNPKGIYVSVVGKSAGVSNSSAIAIELHASGALNNWLIYSDDSVSSYLEGSLGIGTSSLSNKLEVLSSTASNGLKVINTSTVSDSTQGGAVWVVNDTIPAATGKRLGIVAFGANLISLGSSASGAGITSYSTEQWINGSNYGSELHFETCSNGTSTRTNRLTIGNDGAVNIAAAQKLQVAGTAVALPVMLPTPLTSTSWDGDAYSTTSPTVIDLSAVFGVPAGVKAVLVRSVIRDSGSAAAGASSCWFCLGGTNSSTYLEANWANGKPNDYWAESTAIIPCDANGDIYYSLNATGAGTMDVYLQIYGYWL